MSNVLKEEKRQQVLALGRLGWSLRRIEEATGVRRETASGYLKAAGLTVRGRGRPPARPANPAISPGVPTDSSPATAAGEGTAAAAPVPAQQPSRAPQASACEPYRELIVEALSRGRNATAIWQDLVDDHGFPAGYTSVRRFVATVRQQPAVTARAVITTDRGEDYVESRVMLCEADQGLLLAACGHLGLSIISTGTRAIQGGPLGAGEAWVRRGWGCRHGPGRLVSSRGRSVRRSPWISRRHGPGSP